LLPISYCITNYLLTFVPWIQRTCVLTYLGKWNKIEWWDNYFDACSVGHELWPWDVQ
jgi:hypothetical protein